MNWHIIESITIVSTPFRKYDTLNEFGAVFRRSVLDGRWPEQVHPRPRLFEEDMSAMTPRVAGRIVVEDVGPAFGTVPYCHRDRPEGVGFVFSSTHATQ